MTMSQPLGRGWLDPSHLQRRAAVRGRRVGDLVARSLEKHADQTAASPR